MRLLASDLLHERGPEPSVRRESPRREKAGMNSARVYRDAEERTCSAGNRPRFARFTMRFRFSATRNVPRLAVFNDVVTRSAVGAGLPLVDLRVICTTADDFSPPHRSSLRWWAVRKSPTRLPDARDARLRETRIRFTCRAIRRALFLS